MLDIFTINDVPSCTVSPEDHARRSTFQKEACSDFVNSVKKLNGNFSIFDDITCGAELPDVVPFASNPKWKDLPFGAANTCGNASCGALQTAVVMNYLNDIAPDIAKLYFALTPSVTTIIKTLVNNGYRSWKLEKKPGAMSEPVATLEGIKERFPDDEEIQACGSLDEVFEKFGHPSGIGTNLFWLDNVIAAFSTDGIEIANQTRITSISKLLQNLIRGIVVPIRVENSVYLGDENRQGGHYVTWFRVENGMAVIVDTAMENTCGIYKIPVSQVINAIVANPNMAVVWDLEPAVIRLCIDTLKLY